MEPYEYAISETTSQIAYLLVLYCPFVTNQVGGPRIYFGLNDFRHIMTFQRILLFIYLAILLVYYISDSVDIVDWVIPGMLRTLKTVLIPSPPHNPPV